jgi:hypothetical protein
MDEHNDPTQGVGGCNEDVAGENIAYVMHLLRDPMERRHFWWEVRQQMDADQAELRRTKTCGYEDPS